MRVREGARGVLDRLRQSALCGFDLDVPEVGAGLANALHRLVHPRLEFGGRVFDGCCRGRLFHG